MLIVISVVAALAAAAAVAWMLRGLERPTLQRLPAQARYDQLFWETVAELYDPIREKDTP